MITLAVLVVYLLLYVGALLWPGFIDSLEERNFHMTDEQRLSVMHRNLYTAYPQLDFVRGEESIAVFSKSGLLGILTVADYSDEEEQVAIWLS